MVFLVGLGNPGQKYLLNRHNIGFMAVDAFNHAFAIGPYKKAHKTEVASGKLGSNQVHIIKPQTYMNNSGESVRAALDFYKVDPKNMEEHKLLVLHDEIEIGYQSIRYQTGRGHGGHNGIRSIHQHLGTKEYDRLRLGVGRPDNPSFNVADYVLQNFSKQEQAELPDWLNKINDSLEEYIVNGFQKAASQYNITKKDDQ